MKIVFPEILTNSIAKEAIKSFPAIEFLSAPNLDQAVSMLQQGLADSLISGLDYPSRDVILACKTHLPLKSKYFSSCFICEKETQILALTDGGVIKHPTISQLCTIIEDTATTFQTYTSTQPKIALLSYSTHGSGGQDPDFNKITEVITEFKQTHPDYLIDGELQLDAAINPQIAIKKAPTSPLQGQANILVTPDLNSGNILYKSLEQFGGFTCAGPIIQGFTHPIADLSRGSSIADIILTIKVLRSLL